jgi:hypothetical protein
MTEVIRDSNRFLYHGTLLRNLPSIRADGLLPQKGSWTGRFHAKAAAHVFATDDQRKSRLILAIGGQIKDAGLVRVAHDYPFDGFKRDLIQHGAVLVVKAATFRQNPPDIKHAWGNNPGHPAGTEPGDWYSPDSVRVERELIGEEMLTWLNPSETNFIHQYRPALREASKE